MKGNKPALSNKAKKVKIAYSQKASFSQKDFVSFKPITGFPIIALGGSAGGLEAFEKFFANMPPQTGMAFILISHLAPDHISIMPELIQKSTAMNVQQIKDGLKVLPDHVYVVPPKKELDIFDGTLRLTETTGVHGPNLPIDYFFRSLAADQKENAACIILSGMGTDGSLGLQEVKNELGMVMVQDPETAKFDSMPRSAIATGLAEFVLPVEKMPEQLVKYFKRSVSQRQNRSAT